MTLDTVNSLAVPEGTQEVVRHLARHTFCLHVKDFVVRREWHMMGFVVEGTPAGQGQLDVAWVLEQLQAAGAWANAIVELWTPWQQNVEATVALGAGLGRREYCLFATLDPGSSGARGDDDAEDGVDYRRRRQDGPARG